jgi:protein-arginine kinase activator protein McsA
MADQDLEKMTAVQLRELAHKEHPDITGVHAMKREELLRAIRQARGEEVAEKKKAPKVKTKIAKKEARRQIRALRSERDTLIQSKNRKALAKIRKKIKNLKRLTKKAA